MEVLPDRLHSTQLKVPWFVLQGVGLLWHKDFKLLRIRPLVIVRE